MNKQNESNNSNGIKFVLMIFSVILILISLTGGIIVSDKGSVPLFHFESFYIYLIAMAVAFYKVLNNKKSNIPIFIAFLSYFYTCFLCWQMFKYITDIKLHLGIHFYIYLSSSVFLLIALFINDKKVDSNNNKKELIDMKGINSNDFLFTRFVFGFKEIPYDSDILLVNNKLNKSLDLVYSINGEKKTQEISFNNITKVSYTSKVRTSSNERKFTDNEIKGDLLSAVVFGGNPIAQLVGANGFNLLFDSVSNDYAKVMFNVEFEVKIEAVIENENKIIVFTSDINPDKFIKELEEKNK